MLDDMTSGNSNDPPAPGKPLDIPGFPDVHFEPGGGAGSGARLEEVRDGDEIREIWLVPGNSLPTVGRLWVEAGGEMVSELWLVDVTVRAWGGTLRSAGVAGVATPLPHRMKGHARRLMEACERFTADRGYEISTLFGIRDFYHRFGYATICPEYEIRIELNALDMDGPAAALEKACPSDWGPIARMCNAAYASLDGSVVRREGAWQGPKQGSDWGQTPRALVGRDPHGRPAAYAVVDTELTEGCLAVSDAAAGTDATAEALAAGLAELSKARGATGLLARLHPHAGLGPLLTRYGGPAVTTRPNNAGYMARIVDLDAVLQKCKPALTARASSCDLPVPAALHVRTDIGDSRIELGGDAPPAELNIDRMDLVQLLFGYQTFENLRVTGNALARGVTDKVLAALFPRNDGYCFWPDRY